MYSYSHPPLAHTHRHIHSQSSYFCINIIILQRSCLAGDYTIQLFSWSKIITKTNKQTKKTRDYQCYFSDDIKSGRTLRNKHNKSHLLHYIHHVQMYMQKEMVISTSRPYYLRVFVDEWMDGGFLSQLKQKLKVGKDGGELRSICRLTLLLENVTCMYTLEKQKLI